MGTRQRTAAIATALLLAGCGGGGVESAGSNAIDRNAPETFTYAPTQDRTLRAVVGPVLMQRDKGYLPKDRNWLQMHVTVTNLSKRTVNVRDVRARLTNGTMLASAQTSIELAKAPSLSGQAGKALGLGVAGQFVGSFLFPPAALILSGVGMFTTFGGADSWNKRMKRINASMFAGQDLPPGMSIEGDVYIPAVKGQTGLIVFYWVGASAETLTIPRAAGGASK